MTTETDSNLIQENCMEKQLRLGFKTPLPMCGIHWITKDKRHLVRVFDSESRASLAQFELMRLDPETFQNSWLEKE